MLLLSLQTLTRAPQAGNGFSVVYTKLKLRQLLLWYLLDSENHIQPWGIAHKTQNTFTLGIDPCYLVQI